MKWGKNFIVGYSCLISLGWATSEIQRYRSYPAYYNRKVDDVFFNEYLEGMFYLGNKYKNKTLLEAKTEIDKTQEDKTKTDGADNTDNIVTLDIMVSVDLKHFFDDDEDPTDNNHWIQAVEDALTGLKHFEQVGDINFKVNDVMGRIADDDDVSIRTAVLKNKKADILLYIRPCSIRSGLLGRAYNENYVVVSLTGNFSTNKSVIAHEFAHIFGATHTKDMLYQALKDVLVTFPSFGLFREDLMRPSSTPLSKQNYWAKQSIEEINANKHMFEKK